MRSLFRILPVVGMLLITMVACSQSKQVTVRKVSQQGLAAGPTSFNFFYPQTVLNFTIEAVRQTFIPGPYSQFAQKYIGVVAGSVGAVTWQLNGVSLVLSQEPDYSRVFAVEGDPVEVSKVFQLIHESRIFPVTEGWLPISMEKQLVLPKVFPRPVFTDLGPDPFITTEKNTYYSRVPVDSGFVRVPVQRNVVVETNMEDRAKAAADFLFSIRKRRFDLISGETDHSVDGKAMETSLAALDKLEESCLSLFIGKTFLDTIGYHFSYVPTQATNQNAILFRFSEQQGVLASDDFSGRPIMLNVASDSTLQVFKNMVQKPTMRNKESFLFPYILPEVAEVELYDTKSQLVRCRVSVAQLGLVEYFPMTLWK